MKVLRVGQGADDPKAIDLHDQVTIVRGLDPLRRRWLVDALGALNVSQASGVSGQLVAHGIVFPVDRTSLALLDLEQPSPSVVQAQDLPGHDPRIAQAVSSRDAAMVRRRDLTEQITRQRETLGSALGERSQATEELETLRRGEGAAREALAVAEATKARLESELSSAEAESARNGEALSQAVLARDMAARAQAEASDRLERAREQRRDAMAAASAAAAALEQARPLVAADPTDTLVAAKERLSTAERAAGEADPDQDSSPTSRRLAALERRRVELVRLMESIGDAPADPVATALDQVLGASSEAPPVVAALALADTWRDLHQQIGALDTGVSDEERAAEAEVEAARQRAAEAEVEFNQPVLTPEQIAKVEAAHAAVLEAQDRSEGRFGANRTRRKLEDARSEERRVLERLGFSTYADYMMSSSSRGAGPANRSTLDQTRAALADAEAALAALPGAADRARRRTELLQRRDAVVPRVAALLGHEPTGPEAEDELRSLRETVAPDDAALAELAGRLNEAGVAAGEPPHDRDDLVLLARFYLAEHNEADLRRRDIAEALAALDPAIAEVRSARDRGEHEPPPSGDLPAMAQPEDEEPGSGDPAAAATLREARWAEVEAARQAVAEAEQAVEAHRKASESLAALEADLARCGIEEEQAGSAVARAEEELALADGPALADAVRVATEVEAALARSKARETEATQALEDHAANSGLDAIVGAAEERLANAERLVSEAAAAEQSTAAELADVDAAFADATAQEQAALAEAAEVDRTKLVDAVDWELMSRLAALRSVGLAGSVPLVLDDPFSVLDDDELSVILDRVARLSDAVQVVMVTDREAAVAWAAQIGSERAAVHSA